MPHGDSLSDDSAINFELTKLMPLVSSCSTRLRPKIGRVVLRRPVALGSFEALTNNSNPGHCAKTQPVERLGLPPSYSLSRILTTDVLLSPAPADTMDSSSMGSLCKRHDRKTQRRSSVVNTP